MILQHQTAIAELCRLYRVQRLEVFGSAARGHDFDPIASDADFLVEFKTLPNAPSLQDFFELRQALSRLIGREVDLAEAGAIRNPGAPSKLPCLTYRKPCKVCWIKPDLAALKTAC